MWRRKLPAKLIYSARSCSRTLLKMNYPRICFIVNYLTRCGHWVYNKEFKEFYLDLNNLRLHVLVKIIKADRSNIDANTGALINLTLHSIICEISLKLNRQNVGDTSHFTHIVHTWRLCSTFAKTLKTPVFSARAKPLTPPSTWMSPQLVNTMPVLTFAPRHSREVP